MNNFFSIFLTAISNFPIIFGLHTNLVCVAGHQPAFYAKSMPCELQQTTTQTSSIARSDNGQIIQNVEFSCWANMQTCPLDRKKALNLMFNSITFSIKSIISTYLSLMLLLLFLLLCKCMQIHAHSICAQYGIHGMYATTHTHGVFI